MGDWNDEIGYEYREYYEHFYDPDREEETEEETDEMTNEGTLTTVEILKEMAFTATETQRRALEDAISALSENKGDLISRQAVLDLLENTNNGWIINEVLQLPSINSQKIIVNNGTMNITL